MNAERIHQRTLLINDRLIGISRVNIFKGQTQTLFYIIKKGTVIWKKKNAFEEKPKKKSASADSLKRKSAFTK